MDAGTAQGLGDGDWAQRVADSDGPGQGTTAIAGGRGLATARAVLRVLEYLMEKPDGVSSAEMSRLIGRSLPTTRYLLNSLCHEGFAAHVGQHYVPVNVMLPVVPHQLRRGRQGTRGGLEDAVREVSQVTRQRTYLAVGDAEVEIVDILGHQGQPILPGVGPRISGELHSLAIGKVLLAELSPASVHTYVEERGLRAFTRATIVDAGALSDELKRVRDQGYALDVEERVAGFACVAAPLFGDTGTLTGAVGVSVTARNFSRIRGELISAVTGVARGYGAHLRRGISGARTTTVGAVNSSPSVTLGRGSGEPSWMTGGAVDSGA